ncbi:MAG: heavy metal translocating P-type ATPase [Phycisphaerae bacterium]|nr:heavy metal translocating P-type ATPase [Phycisphaerae bacterium]
MDRPCKVCTRSIGQGPGEFCCPGCAAVFEIVEHMALSGPERSDRINALLKGVFPNGLDQDPVIAGPVDTSQTAVTHESKDLHFLIGNMVCPACAWLIHNRLSSLPGVRDVNVNFLAETCSFSFNPMITGADKIETSITELGYSLYAEGQTAQGYNYYRFGAGWFFAINAMMLAFVVYSADNMDIPMSMRWICSILLLIFGTLTPVIATRNILKSGWQQLRHRDLKMESLIVLSSGAAWTYSLYSLITGDFSRLYFEVVALLLMLIETGNLISVTFYHQLSKRIASMRHQLPKKARLCAAQEDFKEIDTLAPGERFTVRQEELIPTDGILLDSAEFDFSFITGESEGVTLKPGQFVGAGAKLLSDEVTLAVPPEGRSSLIETIIESTIAAFNTKHKTPTIGDRISRYFVPAVLVLSTVALVTHWALSGFGDAVLIFLSMLIVACPCAFGIAEPLVLTAAIEWIRKAGIQIFNGNVLAMVPEVIIFDKTGTLTKGRLDVSRLHWLSPEDPQCLDILASLESGIEHPVARTLSALGQRLQLQNRQCLEAGVQGTFRETRYQAGSIRLYPDLALPAGSVESTLVAFGTLDQCLLLIELSDELKPDARSMVASLQGQGYELWICSGDREPIVRRIAEETGITHLQYEKTGQEKREFMTSLQARGKRVMMVGDGINDAESLAASDIGLAVFTGQIPVKMSADGTFLTTTLTPLLSMLSIIHQVRRKIFFNYGWAFLYNAVGIGLAAFGFLSPKFCAFGMVFSNFIVIFNSLTGGRRLQQKS